MIIDESNCQIGNKAMASVLLLYYHLVNESGITNDQGVYLDPEDFDGFSFIDATVAGCGLSLDINENMIREGSVIYLLCELNDVVSEYDQDYLGQDLTKSIFDALESRDGQLVPEANDVISLLKLGERNLDWSGYRQKLDGIYRKYVFGRFQALVGQSGPNK